MMSGLVLSCLLALAAAAPNALSNDNEPLYKRGNQDIAGLTPFGNDTQPYANRGNQDIINGGDSRYGYFNYMLLLKANGHFVCGASLISSTRGLTAAHCTYSFYTYSVVAGELDRSKNDGYEIERKVKSIVKHPDYVHFFQDDIAVLKFDSIPNNKYVKPIPRFTTADGDLTKLSCFIAGWGRTAGSSRSMPDILKYGDMKVITNSACKDKLGTYILGSHVCIENFSAKRASCRGDSGGPLGCYVPGKGYRLVGVTSFERPGCPGDSPSVYTRVTSYESWISRNM